jgi:twinkle protein
MESSASEFLYHTDCSSCGSSDAGSIYSDGHFYCHRCGHYQHGDGEIQSTKQTMSYVEVKGEAVRLAKRNLRAETCRKYKCFKDGELLRFYYQDRSGSVVGAKVKTLDKEFTWEGSNKDKLLYGQWLWSNGGKGSDKFEKKVIITEGELDAMSVHEVFPNWPVVSLPNGARSARKSIQSQLEWLQEFEAVLLFFDNDEDGRNATEEAAAVLPTGKVKIVKIDPKYKDASDALQGSDSKAISSAIWNAEAWTPGGIVSGKDLLTLVTTPNPPCEYEYPWIGLNTKTHGIRYGELVTFTAGSGIGKSSICRELATHLLNNGANVGYLALEESNRRTAQGLMSVHEGKPFHIGEHSAEDLKKAYDNTLAKWNLFLFDGFGSYDPELIYKKIEYMALGLDTKIIFLDHLSILLSGLDGDERRMIDVTMTKLRSLVERTGITLFLVSHLKRTAGDQNHEEGARVTLGQLRGSAAIAQLSDTVIALERNQQDEKGSGTTVRVLKNRLTGEVGPACTLNYNLQTCRYREEDAGQLFEPFDDSTSDF